MKALCFATITIGFALASSAQGQTCCKGVDESRYGAGNVRSTPPSAAPTEAPRQRSQNSSRNNAAIQSATETLLRMLEDDSAALLNQDTQNQLQRAYEAAEEEAKRDALEAQRREQLLVEQKRAREDPTLDPWSASSSSGSAGKGKKAPPPTATNAMTAKDPGKNYAGEPCEYFTRPSDEAHLNYYAEGATVVYGDRAYQCIDRRWRYKHPANVYTDKVRKQYDATKIEGG